MSVPSPKQAMMRCGFSKKRLDAKNKGSLRNRNPVQRRRSVLCKLKVWCLHQVMWHNSLVARTNLPLRFFTASIALRLEQSQQGCENRCVWACVFMDAHAGNGAHRRIQPLKTYDTATPPQKADALLRGHPSRCQTLYNSSVGAIFQRFSVLWQSVSPKSLLRA